MASARKLEQDIETMTETFYSLVRAAYTTEEKDEGIKQNKKVSGDLMEVLAERLVVAGQSVLTLIVELKRQALLSDFAALNKMIDKKEAQHKTRVAESEQRVLAAISRGAVAKDQEPSQAQQQEADLKRLYLLAQEVPLQ